jgi:hypothetical protein
MQVEDALLDVDGIDYVHFQQFLVPISGATQQLTVTTKRGTEFHFYQTSLDEFIALRKPYFKADKHGD